MYVPVAVKFTLVPLANVGDPGAIAIDTRVAGVTINVVKALMPPMLALMFVAPALTAVTTPKADTVA